MNGKGETLEALHSQGRLLWAGNRSLTSSTRREMGSVEDGVLVPSVIYCSGCVIGCSVDKARAS